MFDWRIKQVIKNVVSPALDAAGVFDRSIERGAKQWLIVTYHRVIDTPAPDPFRLGMCVNRRHFARQLSFWSDRFEPIRMDDAIGRIDAGKPLPERALSVTFDDGYADNLEVAAVELARHGMPWTLFVAADPEASEKRFWWDRAISAIAATGRKRLDVDLPGIGRLDKHSLRPWSRRSTVEALLNGLWKLEPEVLAEAVAKIESACGVPANDTVGQAARRMTDTQLSELHASGVELGAHSLSHPNLVRLTPTQLQREVAGSGARIEQITGSKPAGFAYPGGRLDDSVVASVRDSGFSYAVTTGRGLNDPTTDRLRLNRFLTPDSDVADVKRCLAAFPGFATG